MEPDGVVPTSFLADVLGLTKQGVSRLNREGVLPKSGHGEYELAASVQKYLSYRENLAVAKHIPTKTEDRVKLARAVEIERRIARAERDLIEIPEAIETLDRIIGDVLHMVGGLPARLTRDPRERQRIESIIDGERKRLSDNFSQRMEALRTGVETDETDAEEDA